ncbi:MAG: hypothetical protein HUU38_20340 [Anaerolineales bacterium]|nr:hypothetical protein [Anaerolineales bacterium]
MFQPNDPFLLGVNYWPRRKAMYWWKHFDPAEVREEFTIIRDLGLTIVRIFLLWEDFQPTPDTINPQALDDLVTVADIAAELDLKLNVTFFTGHMSGPNWIPSWMLLPDEPMPAHVKQVVSDEKIVNCGYRNPFSDPTVMDAEERLLRAVVPRLVGHSGLGLWNLGNEPDLVAHPPTAEAGRAWVRRMAGVIRELDKATLITCGMHTPSLIMEIGFHVNDVFSEVDLAVMHGYPMYAEGWATGPLDPHFVPGLCALTSALSGKPTLAEEFGGCTEAPGNPSKVWEWTAYGEPRTQFMASEEDFAAYIAQVLPNLVEVGSQGAVLWCFADYVEELWDKPPCKESIHERFFGLVRPDGSLKPHAEVLKQFAATNPVIKTATRKISLDVPADEYYEDPIRHAWKAYQEFLNH